MAAAENKDAEAAANDNSARSDVPLNNDVDRNEDGADNNDIKSEPQLTAAQ